MAIVLRAFDINSGFDLMQRFGGLQPEDLSLVRSILQQSLPAREQDISILRRLLTIPQLPEQQINLNYIFSKLPRSAGHFRKEYVVEGAAAMYSILGHLWPKLYPQNQTAPPQPPPSS